MSNPIRISTPTEIIAAIPALLGFYPTRSVVVIMVCGSTVAAVLRIDAMETDPERSHAAADIADVARKHDVDTALLVAVADAQVAGATLRTLDTVRETLADGGIYTPRPLHVPRIEAGMAWTDLDGYETGVCSGPEVSVVHTAAVVNGTVVESSRDEMAAQYAQRDTVDTDELRAAMEAARELGSDEFARTVLADLHAVVRDGSAPSAALAARVGILLPLHVVARDASLALALSAPLRAHDVMTAIAGQLDGIARADALTVAGYFAYAGGRGPQAGAAFTAAYDAVRDHPANPPRLLNLLEKALRAGLQPAHILDLARTGHGEAAKLGVVLPETPTA